MPEYPRDTRKRAQQPVARRFAFSLRRRSLLIFKKAEYARRRIVELGFIFGYLNLQAKKPSGEAISDEIWRQISQSIEESEKYLAAGAEQCKLAKAKGFRSGRCGKPF
jgi:hypothetical protein